MTVIKGLEGIEAECLLKSKGGYLTRDGEYIKGYTDLCTLRIRFPRFVAEQFLKHRMFSCNAVSSRAMSVPKMNQWIEDHPAKPLFWGAQRKGMQPQEECNNQLLEGMMAGRLCFATREVLWHTCRKEMCKAALEYWDAGYHQQIPNRLTHAFQMAEYIVTATDWDNFFNLRLHDKAAQSEITELARCMKECIDTAPYSPLRANWHLPMVTLSECNFHTLEELKILSAARCAIVSYNNHSTDELLCFEKAEKIFNHLISDTNPHYCYDEETEIFTDHGWISITNLHEGIDVAQVVNFEQDGDANIEFVTPLDTSSFDYNGPMYHFSSKHVDIKVSKDHRMLVKNRSKKGLKPGWEILPSQAMIGKDFAVRTCAGLREENFLQGEYQEGWYWGFMLGDGRKASRGVIEARLKKERKITALRSCLRYLAKDFKESRNPEGVVTFYIVDFSDLPITSEKKLPGCLFEKHPSYLRGLFQGLMDSDGSVKRNTYTFSSTSKDLIYDLDILCTLVGMRMTEQKPHVPKNPDHRASYRVNIASNTQQHVKHTRGEISVRDEICKIYCCSVPSGMLLTRRNGKVAVCGNTPLEHQARILTHLEQSDIDASIVMSRRKQRQVQYFANLHGWVSHRYILEHRL